MELYMLEADRERMVRIETKLDSNAKSLGILFKSIEGNGRPGLKDRVTGLEIVVNDHIKCHDSQTGKSGNVIQVIITLVMIITVAINIIMG
jgi:hypothetical protein